MLGSTGGYNLNDVLTTRIFLYRKHTRNVIRIQGSNNSSNCIESIRQERNVGIVVHPWISNRRGESLRRRMKETRSYE